MISVTSAHRLLSSAFVRQRGRETVSATNSSIFSSPSSNCCHLIQRRFKQKYVRVIALEDLPHGKAYKGDVLLVKPGYVRNYLYPNKYVVYATRQNFLNLGMKDPEQETPRERRIRLARQALNEADQDLKAADILRKYLANKVLTIWRKIDDEDSDLVPMDRKGVDAGIIKKKLSKQLKIDLEDHEVVCIRDELVDSFMDYISLAASNPTENKEKLKTMMEEMGDKDMECPEVRRLGNYFVRIWLRGDHFVPLMFTLERKP